ncbi:MAG: arabinan endo-1,5-alpha-L-arabinosidase, partial [Akkermansiaceae bacterium]|nr:arabinan endo-1,5-alpha-L-arabinosidase [Akkermansiaceae bacterium]
EGAVQGVHDPAIFKQDDTYYLFSTGHTNPGMAIRCSEDLVRWEFCSGVFFGLPRWTREEVPAVTNLWAPDISYFNGRYHLYYSV